MTEQRELTRDVEATLIPHGDPYPLKAGETVTITHRLGGNFTVTTGFGMYRIAAADADALGKFRSELERGPLAAQVAGVVEQEAMLSEALTSFSIRG